MAKLDPLSLKLFLSVVEMNSIASAASAHHIAATAVSKRISDLEQLFGTVLLQRNNRGVHATEAGFALAAHARRALNELDSIQIAMQDYCAGGVGLVTLCASTSAMSQFLARDLTDFLMQHPGLKIAIDEQPSDEALRLLTERAVQIAVVTNVSDTHGLELWPYRRDRLVVVCHADHPLAQRRNVAFHETLRYDYVGWFSGGAINKQLEAAAKMSQCNWQVRARVNSFDALVQMVAAQIGIGVLPEGVAKEAELINRLSVIYLTDTWAARDFFIAIQSVDALPEPALNLFDYLREFAGQASCDAQPLDHAQLDMPLAQAPIL